MGWPPLPFAHGHDPIPFPFRVLPFQGEYVWCLGFLSTFAFIFVPWLVDGLRRRPPTVGHVQKFTVNPLLSKEREAPNPQTLGCARDALSGA